MDSTNLVHSLYGHVCGLAVVWGLIGVPYVQVQDVCRETNYNANKLTFSASLLTLLSAAKFAVWLWYLCGVVSLCCPLSTPRHGATAPPARLQYSTVEGATEGDVRR